MLDFDAARRAICEEGLDGWLLYDFKGLNPIARLAAAPGGKMLTRRFFCLIPREGRPRWLVHAIERAQFEGVPGEVETFADRAEMRFKLRGMIRGLRTEGAPRLAVEYSAEGNIPSISFVDAGTLELLRASGADIVSSGDLIQAALARWPARGMRLHEEARDVCERAARRAWDAIGAAIRAGRPLTECAVQSMLLADMEAAGLVWNGPPIVAVDAHAADPHFATGPEDDRPIRAGCVIMLDIWGKKGGDPDAVYADITQMGFAGERPPDEVARVWDLAVRARERALATAQEGWRAGLVRAFEVDRAARDLIRKEGYGPFFTHRTGHSLGAEDHWIGANMDDFETHDERRLVAGTGFTIEPGIYLPGRFGVRTEIDVFVGPDGPAATTWRQKDLVLV
jgi:Xaa-Pro aminopeptidase